jgi:hypothetical protein
MVPAGVLTMGRRDVSVLDAERPPPGGDGLFFVPERLGVSGDGVTDQTVPNRTAVSNKLNYPLV